MSNPPSPLIFHPCFAYQHKDASCNIRVIPCSPWTQILNFPTKYSSSGLGLRTQFPQNWQYYFVCPFKRSFAWKGFHFLEEVSPCPKSLPFEEFIHSNKGKLWRRILGLSLLFRWRRTQWIILRHNLNSVHNWIKANKVAHEIDGTTVEQALPCLRKFRDEPTRKMDRCTGISMPDSSAWTPEIPTVVNRIIQRKKIFFPAL